MLIRTQIWNRMFNAKFKATFACECSRWAKNAGNLYSIIIVVGTTGSIAAWAIWQQFPLVWAVLVAVAQVLHVIKPYVPYIGSEKEFLDASHQFERLAIDYERLWKAVELRGLTEIDADEKLHELQNKELDIEIKYQSHCPKLKILKDRAHDVADTFVRTNFGLEL